MKYGDDWNVSDCQYEIITGKLSDPSVGEGSDLFVID